MTEKKKSIQEILDAGTVKEEVKNEELEETEEEH